MEPLFLWFSNGDFSISFIQPTIISWNSSVRVVPSTFTYLFGHFFIAIQTCGYLLDSLVYNPLLSLFFFNIFIGV